MLIKLRKPLRWKNEEITELDLQFDNLTPNDLIDVEEDVVRTKNVTVALDFSRYYRIALAARALKLPTETLMQMHIKDFQKVIAEVQSFLLDTDSNETTGAETPETSPEIS